MKHRNTIAAALFFFIINACLILMHVHFFQIGVPVFGAISGGLHLLAIIGFPYKEVMR